MHNACHHAAADPLSVSVWWQFLPKATEAPGERHRSASVALCGSPEFTPKNAVLGVMRPVLINELLLDTQALIDVCAGGERVKDLFDGSSACLITPGADGAAVTRYITTTYAHR